MKVLTKILFATVAACFTMAEATAEQIEVTTPGATRFIVRPVSPTVVKVTALGVGQTAPESRASVLDKTEYDGGTVVRENGKRDTRA